MKIFNVSFTTRTGGLEQAFLDYNQALKLHGHEVISILHSNSKIIPLNNERVCKIWNFSKYDPITLFILKVLVKQESPDLIITHGNRAHYMMQKVAGPINVVGVAHGYGFDYIKHCDHIISVSNHIKQSIINTGHSADKISYIPNMVHIPNNLEFSIPQFNKIPIIGAMGRLNKIKGIDSFVKAMNLLKQKKIEFKAIIAGDGVEYNNIKTLIKELGLETEVMMLGWITDKAVFYNAIDIFCIPSIEEPFGIVILEAFMYSTPVIVSELPGPLEIVQPNIDSLIFEAGNIIELAEQIEFLINNQEVAQILAKNAFDNVKSYDINFIGNRLADLVLKLS